MGQIKTQKLDNGAIGFECIYGGVEAPFGGIDASKAPRYIEPNCFADASNFLIVDNELCICNLFAANFPSNGLTYPYPIPVGFGGISDPVSLIGVGTLPCEGVVKNWALYSSTGTDTNNFWHYRLILWTNDSATVESYDFSVSGQTVTVPATSATATLTVSWADAFTADQSLAEFTLQKSTQTGPTYGPPFAAFPPPYALGGLVYDVAQWLFNIGGVPTNNLYPSYGVGSYASQIFRNLYLDFFSGAAPGSLPTLSNIATAVATLIHNMWTNGYIPFDGVVSGSSINLTAKTPTAVTPGVPYYVVEGNAGNAITLSGGTAVDFFGFYPVGGGSFEAVVLPKYNTPTPFTTPSFNIEFSGFQGGKDAYTFQQQPIKNLTWETKGDNLYLTGYPANYMLQFNNTTKHFGYLTQYEGARVLKKMADHLISVGMIAGLDLNLNPLVITEQHLWFSWSKAGDPTTWNSLDASNLQTGAGGTQLADISDMLTGLIVSNSVAFILRAEGLSYAQVNPTSAQLPFEFNHVALCKVGQGCPSTSLWTQFDQVGFFVGNSNIFMLQQAPQAIGDKIIGGLYPDLIAQSDVAGGQFADYMYQLVNVEPLTILINNRPITVFAVNIKGRLYVLSPQDGTWMKFDTISAFPTPPGGLIGTPTNTILKCISLPANGIMGYGGSFQYKGSYIYAQQVYHTSLSVYQLQAPFMYQFLPKVSPQQNSYITFPAEEISHGRDITIDAVYATISGFPGTIVNMFVSGWQGNPSVYVSNAFVGQVVLDSNAIPDQYEEYQFFNSDGSAITLKAPQLQLYVAAQTVPAYTPPLGTVFLPYPQNSNPGFKCSKISMFGSFDPNQRPV